MPSVNVPSVVTDADLAGYPRVQNWIDGSLDRVLEYIEVTRPYVDQDNETLIPTTFRKTFTYNANDEVTAISAWEIQP